MTSAQIKKVISAVYESRKIRLTNPEGEFIGKSWFPHAREQGEDSMGSVKEPTDAGRYSYMIHCRSKAHVRHLVGRAMQGYDVPDDVSKAFAQVTVRASVKPTTVIEGVSVKDLPQLMAEFAQFLALREKTKEKLDSHRRS